MSQENVETIRALFDDWTRGDLGLDRMDPEISMFESTTLPGAASAVGIEAVRRYQESFARYWREIRFEPTEFVDAGEQVVVVARLIGRGRESGVAVERVWAYVWTLRHGKVLRMDGYENRSEALKAVGLEE
jgi:ketosteroid isomerase-like protein